MKVAIIINGKPQSGKDTFCEMLAKKYRVANHSSIDPIKEILKFAGWNGIKTDHDRDYMSRLKQLLTDYNNFPTEYCYKKYMEFLDSNDEVIFFHIREPKEIAKLAFKIGDSWVTLLVRREGNNKIYGNSSDNDVENYSYTNIYNNNKSLNEMQDDVIQFFEKEIVK